MVLGSIPWSWDRSLGSELNMICPKDLGPSNGFGWTNQYFTGVFFSPQNEARTLRVQWSLGCNHKSGWVLACLYINSKKKHARKLTMRMKTLWFGMLLGIYGSTGRKKRYWCKYYQLLGRSMLNDCPTGKKTQHHPVRMGPWYPWSWMGGIPWFLHKGTGTGTIRKRLCWL